MMINEKDLPEEWEVVGLLSKMAMLPKGFIDKLQEVNIK